MNLGATVERVYIAIRELILHGDIRPGARLDPAALAPPLGSSVTPIREALHILSGEGLVEARPGEGFFVPNIDEPALRDLYHWNAQLLFLAIQGWDWVHVTRRDFPGSGNAAEQAASLFLSIARRSRNAEHARAVHMANARLHSARLVEASLFTDMVQEIGILTEALAIGDRPALRRLITAYHRRRVKIAAEIVRRLYREMDGGAPV